MVTVTATLTATRHDSAESESVQPLGFTPENGLLTKREVPRRGLKSGRSVVRTPAPAHPSNQALSQVSRTPV